MRKTLAGLALFALAMALILVALQERWSHNL